MLTSKQFARSPQFIQVGSRVVAPGGSPAGLKGTVQAMVESEAYIALDNHLTLWVSLTDLRLV